MTLRSLATLVEEIADVDWRHPAWLAVVGGTALLESAVRLAPRPVEPQSYATFISANGGPRSDTFMARDRPAVERAAAERIARAVARARAAAAALGRLDRAWPEQPLLHALTVDRGWLRRLPAAAARADFITPRGVLRADLGTPTTAIAEALGALCAGHPPVLGAAAGAAAVAVDLSPQPLASARHLHRRAWTAAGGPWLGVGEAAGLELVTTCHLMVDGFGHGLIAADVFRALDAGGDAAALAAAAQRGLRGASVAFPEARPIPGALPLGFAGRVVPSADLTFPRAVYALARSLEPLRRLGARLGPTIQIAVAPGDGGDADRRSRRVLFGLVALRRGEPFSAFRARLRAALERELAGRGLLMRVLDATAAAPLPRELKRRLIVSRGRPHPLLPPIEALAGRAAISLIRYPGEPRPAAPLYGLSAPGLEGGLVVTIIDHGASSSIALAGSDDAGARAALDLFVEELSQKM